MLLSLVFLSSSAETVNIRTDCGPKTGCHGCGGSLPARRRSWCSDACALRVVTNHDWQSVRAVVLKRDDHRCVVCTEDDKGEKASAYHKRTGKTYLEVNHIKPVNGRRKNWDCQNHQDNLETLCHDCHVAVTKQQAAVGLIGRKTRHLFRIKSHSPSLIQCVRCGAAETKYRISDRAPLGQRVSIWSRRKEVCYGPTLKRRRGLHRGRVVR